MKDLNKILRSCNRLSREKYTMFDGRHVELPWDRRDVGLLEGGSRIDVGGRILNQLKCIDGSVR